MDDRAGLIERAAALLREGDSRASVPVTPGMPESPVAGSASAPPLSRSVVLDRDHLAQTGIIMPWTTMARVVEEFRIIKRNIMFPWQLPEYSKAANRPPRVVMVTSSRPREGKTYCSINLALAFAAEENLVTVLIDGDAVQGDAAKVLKVPPDPGWTDILTGERRLHDVLIQTDIPNLVVLPPGAHGPQIPELLAGRGPSLVFAEIAKRYPEHVIIMDTPPCLASTDPAALAPVVSQVVFVIEAGHTQKTEIESSLNLLSGCPQISFLLNKTPVGSSEHFGSYSYYYRTDTTAAKAGED
jgi:receptor protein-tyrosine kinase